MSAWFLIRLRDKLKGLVKKQKMPDRRTLSNDSCYANYRAEVRKEVDRLLEKIAKYGRKSLTGKELRYLNESKDFV